MALTRAIQSILVNNTISIRSLIGITGNPFIGSGFNEMPSFGSQWAFNGTSGPLAAELWYGALTLSGGSLAIDLTALVDSVIGTVSLSGKKMMLLALQAPGTNVAAITWAPAGLNGYSGPLNAGGTTLNQNDQILFGPLNNSGLVGSGAKAIALSGTGTDSLNVIMLFG